MELLTIIRLWKVGSTGRGLNYGQAAECLNIVIVFSYLFSQEILNIQTTIPIHVYIHILYTLYLDLLVKMLVEYTFTDLLFCYDIKYIE